MNRTFRFVHLVMMVLVILFCAVSAVLAFRGLFNRTVVLADEERTVVWFYMFLNIFVALGVASAMVYFFHGSAKFAAIHYKVFMLLIMGACFCEILMNVRDLRLTRNVSIWGELAFTIVKAVILLVMGVGLDHGKNDTHILFIIFLLADIALIIMNIHEGMTSFPIMGVIARVFTDAVLFFTIRNKYIDKATRGKK